ncbi:MAG: hypothetical protein ACREKS_02590 [Candidatus Rokuibacteriota bacterium]
MIFRSTLSDVAIPDTPYSSFILRHGPERADRPVLIDGPRARRVAPHKKIRRLEVVETIPKSASGKLLRRVLVEQERASQNR